METRYSKIAAREINEATVQIYGYIGEQVQGDVLANEINYLAEKVDIINIRINSMGGSFIQGLSIISAITASRAKFTAIIEGIAGSMAAFIAIACGRVKMNDFARLMFHAPYYRDDQGVKTNNLTDEEKLALDNLKGLCVDLLVGCWWLNKKKRKTKAEINAILEKDSWYTAEEAFAEGFIHEIIDTGVAREAAKLSIDKLVAFANDKFLPNNTDMKKIAAKLGLPETADEQAIIAAIDQKETSLGDSRKKLVDAVIAAGRKSGTINDTNVASMTRLGSTDIDLLVDLVIKPVEGGDNTRLSDVIAKVNEAIEGLKNPDAKKDDKNWDWYQKNDSEALAVMKIKEPDKYKKLYKEFWGQEWDGK